MTLSEASWQPTAGDLELQERLSTSAWRQFMETLSLASEPCLTKTNAANNARSNNSSEAIDRLLRLTELKHMAAKLAGGDLLQAHAAQIPPEIEEQFWESLVAFEKAPRMSRREVLRRSGFTPRPPHTLSDTGLHSELWRLIETLAIHGVFLAETDHLSDRELYSLLLSQVLDEVTTVLPQDSGWRCHICIREYGLSGDEDGTDLYLRYYADEEDRQQWQADFPNHPLPPKEQLPYNRDEFLPE